MSRFNAIKGFAGKEKYVLTMKKLGFGVVQVAFQGTWEVENGDKGGILPMTRIGEENRKGNRGQRPGEYSAAQPHPIDIATSDPSPKTRCSLHRRYLFNKQTRFGLFEKIYLIK